MVKQKDMQVAAILEALATTKTSSGKPMIEETIVAMVADHGGYKNNHNWNPSFIAEVYVPLLLRGNELYRF
jgi:phosphoglycerol transferase MdoB-like AlkP superfamily enzyme